MTIKKLTKNLFSLVAVLFVLSGLFATTGYSQSTPAGITETDNLTTSGMAATFGPNPGRGSISVEVSGTWVGTLYPKVSITDSDSKYVYTQLYDIANQQFVSSISTNGTYYVMMTSGLPYVELKAVSFTSGTAVVKWYAANSAPPTLPSGNSTDGRLDVNSYAALANAADPLLEEASSNQLSVDLGGYLRVVPKNSTYVATPSTVSDGQTVSNPVSPIGAIKVTPSDDSDGCQANSANTTRGFVVIDALNTSGIATLVSGTSAKKTSICGGLITVSGASGIRIFGATSCGGGTGFYSLLSSSTAGHGLQFQGATGGGFVLPVDGFTYATTTTAADEICIAPSSSSIQMSGFIRFAKHP